MAGIFQTLVSGAKKNGYYVIPRIIEESDFWENCSLAHQQIFRTILRKSAYQEKNWDRQGELVIIKPGQFITTYRSLARLSKTSLQSVKSFLEKFKKAGFLQHTSTRHDITISLSNYEIYTLTYHLTNTQPTHSQHIKKEYKEYKERNSSSNIYNDNESSPQEEIAAAAFSEKIINIAPFLKDANFQEESFLPEKAIPERSFSQERSFQSEKHLTQEKAVATERSNPPKVPPKGSQPASPLAPPAKIYECLATFPILEQQKAQISAEFNQERVEICVLKVLRARNVNPGGHYPYLMKLLREAQDLWGAAEIKKQLEQVEKEAAAQFLQASKNFIVGNECPDLLQIVNDELHFPCGFENGRAKMHKVAVEKLYEKDYRDYLKGKIKEFVFFYREANFKEKQN